MNPAGSEASTLYQRQGRAAMLKKLGWEGGVLVHNNDGLVTLGRKIKVKIIFTGFVRGKLTRLGTSGHTQCA